jgi:hypothetical protein
MHKQQQKGMFVRVENFGIESKSKRGFEKGDMHVVSQLNQQAFCHQFMHSNLT